MGPEAGNIHVHKTFCPKLPTERGRRCKWNVTDAASVGAGNLPVLLWTLAASATGLLQQGP
jgi:hypothetical protein